MLAKLAYYSLGAAGMVIYSKDSGMLVEVQALGCGDKTLHPVVDHLRGVCS